MSGRRKQTSAVSRLFSLWPEMVSSVLNSIFLLKGEILIPTI